MCYFIRFLPVCLIGKGLFAKVSVILPKMKQQQIVPERFASFHIDLKFSTNRNLVEKEKNMVGNNKEFGGDGKKMVENNKE